MGISSKLSWVVDKGNISARKVAWLRYVMVRLMCPSACHNEIHTMHQNTGLQSANAKPQIIPKSWNFPCPCLRVAKTLRFGLASLEGQNEGRRLCPFLSGKLVNGRNFLSKDKSDTIFTIISQKIWQKKNSIAWNLLESLVTNQACQLSVPLSRPNAQLRHAACKPRTQGPKDTSCFNDSTKWRYMEDLCISLQIWIERFSLRAESVFSHGTLLRKFHHPSICGSATTFPADFQTSFITWHQFTTDNAWRNQFHLRMHCDFETAITMMLAWCLYPPHLRSRSVQGFADRLKTCCDWVWFKQDYCT